MTPYTSPHKATQSGLIFLWTFIPTTPQSNLGKNEKLLDSWYMDYIFAVNQLFMRDHYYLVVIL